MRLVFVGGGTGGHFYPLMAVAEAVREKDKAEGRESQLFYMGPDVYNQSALDTLNISFTYCPAGKRRNYFSFLNYLDVGKNAFGLFVAFFKLLKLYPDVVMSKGGYTSLPVVLAAALLRIPVVVHESDAVPGRANSIAARFARVVAIAHPEVGQLFPQNKVVVVGMPIRRAFMEKLSDPHLSLGIGKERPIVLVTGGSTGAERLNNFVIGALPQLLQSYTIIHQVGDANVEKVSSTASSLFKEQTPLSYYYVFGHLTQEKFAAAMQAASVVVTRGGSTTLFEVALNHKPAIVVPIPEDVSRDQRSNAYAYARETGAIVLEEHNLSDDILAAEINRVLTDQATYTSMVEGTKALTAEDAAYKLADILASIGKEHE